MRARIWGCRGSLATPGPSTVRYGGNTTCVELRPAGGGVIVLDGGTGVHPLGRALAAEGITNVNLLLTHLHLDHVEGLGFFAPFFIEECAVTIWGPRPTESSLRDHIAAYLSPPFFPLPFERFGSRVEFIEISNDTWELGGVRIHSERVQHPGNTLGYRFEERDLTFAFIPDNEPALDRDSGVALAQGVDVLFHDAQFTAEEYATRVGWGHSALPDFAEFVRTAAPRRTVMFHHDPDHDDDQLDDMLVAAGDLLDGESVELAHEGLEVALAPEGTPP
jgi:phosphoribosyl 1,2-cyclic phosphodiesterase